MAASTPLVSPLLSHKQRKAASRKERRKRKRQAIAKARDGDFKHEISPQEGEGDDNVTTEEESRRLHEEWLERERRAQEEFRLKFEREEAIRKRKEEEEGLIREEWEARQKKEQEEKEQKLQEKRDREEAVQKMLDEAESQLANGVPWMNPEAPVKENSDNYGTERDVANCPFFLKTGACRFGERCSRKHVYPASSPTLMIRGMFVTFGMEEARRDDYDGDACLEHSEEDLLESFTEFYRDVLPEFRSVGRVVQFKVSCNYEPHLRGNVYVQFETEEQCKQAFLKFNGRWYAGRQLHCEICPVTRWKNAICGLFDRRKCPKGKNCNFLHVFRNPGNEFWEADRDMNMSPDHSVRGSHRDWNSERNTERSWRSRQGSRSPVRSERSHSRRENNSWRSRSRSQERRSSHHQRSERWSVRSRHSMRGRDHRSRSRESSCSKERERERNRSRERSQSRGRDRERNRSRERSQSRGRDRERNRSRERSQSRGRDRERNRSRERSQSRGRDRERNRSRERSQSRGRDRERNRSRERSQSRGRDRERSRGCDKETGSRDKSIRSRSRGRVSPKQQEGKGKPLKDKANSQCHKHSKKSKKKSKKKHKKKDRLSVDGASSGESDKEQEFETSQKHLDSNNGQDSKHTEVLSPSVKTENAHEF